MLQILSMILAGVQTGLGVKSRIDAYNEAGRASDLASRQGLMQRRELARQAAAQRASDRLTEIAQERQLQSVQADEAAIGASRRRPRGRALFSGQAFL